jgi:Family of unknown function (DUF6272)
LLDPFFMLTQTEVKDLLIDPKTDWFYLGDVDEDLISAFVSLVESRPHFVGLPRSSRRRLISAVVECLQNIQNYTPLLQTPSASSVVFMQRFEKNEYSLMCGNVMNSDEVEQLKLKIDSINSVDSEQLRQMYMKQMENTLLDGSRTNAGLGLLEIARAANGPIRYKFMPQESGHTFFSIELFFSLN